MKSSVYINKEAYLAYKILSVISIFFGGIISFIMLVGFGMDLISGKGVDKDIIEIFSVCSVLFIFFHFINYKLSRANMYNSLFENDPDGVLPLKVLARAMGQDIKKIKKEVRRFISLRILINCRIDEEQSENIVLTRFDSIPGWEKRPVICKNCGAENYARMGYVYSCSYCGSKLDGERVANKTRNQQKIYLDKAKIITAEILSGIAGIILSSLETILFFIAVILIPGFFTDKEHDVNFGSVYVMIMTFVFFGIIWYGAFKIFLDAFKAGKLNSLFIKDEDGLVEISDAAKHVHMRQSKFFFYFYKLIGKKKLLNCSVFSEDPTYILLDNGANDIRKKYAVCHCRSCGAPSTLRIGFERNCKYCGAEILNK